MRRVLTLVLFGAACAALPTAAAAQKVPADLIVRGGKIITVDERFGTVKGLAVRAGRIVAAGTADGMEPYVGGSTRVIELGDNIAIPGFIEGHGHFPGVGESQQILDLMTAKTWQEIVRQVEAAAAEAEPGEWIVGRGWHQEKWQSPPEGAVEGFPTHHDLSAVTPDNPVSLVHASGHAAFFNKKAMDLAGITKDTKAPEGGEILVDAAGDPIGVFRETAQGLVRRLQSAAALRISPTERRAALIERLRLADKECLSKGITSFQDAGSSYATIDAMRLMAERGELGVRLYVMIRDGNTRRLAKRLPDYRMIGVGDNHLTVRALKRSIDGALGPRGAWLLDPYADSPDSTGLNTASIESVTETARLAVEHDFQLCVHAIGDRANREVLDIFESFLTRKPGIVDGRWRVEHAQHLSAADIPRFATLGVIASMQGVHCTSDAVYVLQRLGHDRAKEGAYVWQKLLRTGAVVINGTDAPVEDVDPIASYFASVTRELDDGSTFFPDQAMSRMEALRSYTLDAAYAAFEEDIKGSLTPGKLADITILSQDITEVPAERIRETEVVATIVGGKVAYER